MTTAGTTTKIQGARFIITMDPQRRIIANGSLLVRGQRIERVGKAAELAGVAADYVIDATEMVVTPGFCNAHMHISYAHASRGAFPDDLDLPGYLAHIGRLSSVMTEEDEYLTTLLGITELLKYGTTCFLDPGSTRYLDACMEAYRQSGCRIIIGKTVADVAMRPGMTVPSTEEAVGIMERTIKAYDGSLDGRVRAWAMPTSSDGSTPDLLQAAKRLADQYDTGMTVHMINQPSSVELHQRKYGMRPVEHLENIGVLGPNVLLSHVVDLSGGEIDAMARTQARAAMCPTASLRLGLGTTLHGKLPEMRQQGVCVGIGTDSGNSSSLLETMRAMYLVAVLYKDARQDPTMVPAEAALEMATIEGAQALGLDGDIGSIEAGKKADLVLFDTRRPEWRTLFNPVNNLVYNADGRSVDTVMVDGKVVVRGGKPLFVDEWELAQKVQQSGEQIQSRAGYTVPQRWPVV